jgi:hypothetical protein
MVIKQFGILKHKTNKTDVSFTIEQVNLTPLQKEVKWQDQFHNWPL